MSEGDSSQAEKEKNDLHLLNQLRLIGADEVFVSLVPQEQKEGIRTCLNTQEWVTATGELPPLNLEPLRLQDEAPIIIDEFIRHAEELVEQGKPGPALGHLNEGLRTLLKSLLNRGLDAPRFTNVQTGSGTQFQKLLVNLGRTNLRSSFVSAFHPA